MKEIKDLYNEEIDTQEERDELDWKKNMHRATAEANRRWNEGM
jgi:hypothetical protein